MVWSFRLRLTSSFPCSFCTGVPKTRRGEIWRFLAKQHEFYSPLPEYRPWMQKSFEELKEVSSSHQHSIFIDLGKILSDSARPVYFIPLVSLVPKLQTAGLLWSSVIRGKKMKMVGNFATWWHAGVGRHLVDVLRDDGKFELAVRRMESKHGGGWLDDIFDGFEAQELAQFNKEETHFQNDNV